MGMSANALGGDMTFRTAVSGRHHLEGLAATILDIHVNDGFVPMVDESLGQTLTTRTVTVTAA